MFFVAKIVKILLGIILSLSAYALVGWGIQFTLGRFLGMGVYYGLVGLGVIGVVKGFRSPLLDAQRRWIKHFNMASVNIRWALPFMLVGFLAELIGFGGLWFWYITSPLFVMGVLVLGSAIQEKKRHGYTSARYLWILWPVGYLMLVFYECWGRFTPITNWFTQVHLVALILDFILRGVIYGVVFHVGERLWMWWEKARTSDPAFLNKWGVPFGDHNYPRRMGTFPTAWKVSKAKPWDRTGEGLSLKRNFWRWIAVVFALELAFYLFFGIPIRPFW